jgi:hypothetical protein
MRVLIPNSWRAFDTARISDKAFAPRSFACNGTSHLVTLPAAKKSEVVHRASAKDDIHAAGTLGTLPTR